jgi:hypothetical protein
MLIRPAQRHDRVVLARESLSGIDAKLGHETVLIDRTETGGIGDTRLFTAGRGFGPVLVASSRGLRFSLVAAFRAARCA